MPKAALMLLLGFVLLAGGILYADEPPAPVRAYFLGYENDDVIFRIFNESGSAIGIKGLSFDHQILYRPVDKDAAVPVSSEENPYKDVVFRTTGDFVWSENHMGMFQLAYQSTEKEERMYGEIHPQWPPLVSQKELVTETVP